MKLSTVKYIFFKLIPNIFILTGLGILLITYGPVIKDEFWYYLKVSKAQTYSISDPQGVQDSIFSRFLTTSPVRIEPVNTDFSLVIEKIGVNAPIVKDVAVSDKDAYFEALKSGVAHAGVSELPSERPGNVYLFAHSSINFWRFGKYATVFNLLRKLELGDRIHVFYGGDDYIYEVVNTETLKGFNTYPITRPVIEPTLTLQTCDPPGTSINRLVVTSKLIEVKDNDSENSANLPAY